MKPTTSSPWTLKVRFNFTPRRPRALGVLGASNSDLEWCCRDAFAEQEELVRSLEQKQAQQSRRWRVRFRFPIVWALALRRKRDLAVSAGRWFASRFGDFVLTSATVLCAARLRGLCPGLRGLPGLLQLPPRLVSLGTGRLLTPVYSWLNSYFSWRLIPNTCHQCCLLLSTVRLILIFMALNT
jgi:hypothetical protein